MKVRTLQESPHCTVPPTQLSITSNTKLPSKHTEQREFHCLEMLREDVSLLIGSFPAPTAFSSTPPPSSSEAGVRGGAQWLTSHLPTL
jgi:hypothetical protein